MSMNFSGDTKLGVLLDHPEAKEVLIRFLPEIKTTAGSMLKIGRGMTLRKIAGFPQAKISPEKLQAIETELMKI